MKHAIDPTLDLVLERHSDVSPEPFFTAVVTFEPDARSVTKYTAVAIHRDQDGRKQHESMGFHEGWGQVYTQMIEFIQSTPL